MDILYIIGTGSKWNNNELRYSLRSIEKYGQNVDRIIISGHCPDFIDKSKVTYVPCSDKYPGIAHKNILYKTVFAAESLGLSKFWISSDDHYYIKPFDFNNDVVLYRDYEICTFAGGNVYRLSMNQTKSFLLDHKLSVYQTNPHCNTVFDYEVYKNHKSLFDASFKSTLGIEMNCLMGNLRLFYGAPAQQFNDCKLSSGTNEKMDDLKAFTFCISSYDSMQGSRLANLLNEEFPQPSRYELFADVVKRPPVATCINSWCG